MVFRSSPPPSPQELRTDVIQPAHHQAACPSLPLNHAKRRRPPGSTVPVTGANGLIASNVVEEFLALGYNVLGTVRSSARCAWLTSFFASRHGPHRGAFTLLELPDLGDERAFADAFTAHRVAAVCLTTSNMDFAQPEPEPFISGAVETVRAPMRAALKSAPHVKSFVVTGSMFAVWSPRSNDARALDAETYNDDAVAGAYADAWTDPAARGFAIFAAAFVAKDRAARAFVAEEKPGFRVSVLLVDSVLGRVLDVEHQGLPTTVGFLAGIWEGGEKAKAARAFVKPQYYLDAEDCGKLHVAAAVRADVVNERIFACGGPFTWNRILRIMKENWPQQKFEDEDETEGESLSKVPIERGAALLRDMGGQGWTSLEESVRKTVATAKLLSR
ncbi:Pseudouridine synthase/archaeosine transglycosylase [Macrophomina phaseolina MS6]|uniref:Pseudouridine synthase/archaeosine transglycosylase n=1 Tax=Macrophomina phaseolina (strain MS6) TaxID=1126212 RepID=K2RY01_MACPH|nr:Pseudouridine synthase/archaeosine transglycosylase [Macrophomina phaseolina MS6]